MWINHWNKELDAFVLIDTMMREEKTLFQMHEQLRAEHPDTLRIHHPSIEKQCVEYKCKQD